MDDDIVEDYAPYNPLLNQVSKTQPAIVQVALTEGPAPTMWVSGNLPPFTASGLDPQVLNRLPWATRHWAAAEPDKLKVLGVIEQYGDFEGIEMEHSGLEAYKQRFSRWMSGIDAPKKVESKDEADALYEQMFGTSGK